MTPSFKVNENKKESDKNMSMLTVLCNKLNPFIADDDIMYDGNTLLMCRS